MEEVIPYFGEELDSFKLMLHVLKGTGNEGDKCRFACPIGKGSIYMQRVRMRITRLREKLKKEGRSTVRFRLETEIESKADSCEDHVTVTRVLLKDNNLRQALDAVEIEKDLVDDFTV